MLIRTGNKDVAVEISAKDEGKDIVAKGQEVAFIEVGEGVYQNPSEP